MFFRHGETKPPSEDTKGEIKGMSGDFAFSKYLGVDAAKELHGAGGEEKILTAGIDESAVETLGPPAVVKDPEPWPMNRGGIKIDPIPPILPPRVPPAKKPTGGFDVPIMPPPPPNAPKVNIPPNMPGGMGRKIPPIPNIPIGNKAKIEVPMEPIPKKEKAEEPKIDPTNFEKVRKSLTDFVKTLESLNADIMAKVSDLETVVTDRSKVIKKEAKHAFTDAIERARAIKEVMHESELKNLEIQEKTMDLLDRSENRIIERGPLMSAMDVPLQPTPRGPS